jgi:hypothetical protein
MSVTGTALAHRLLFAFETRREAGRSESSEMMIMSSREEVAAAEESARADRL